FQVFQATFIFRVPRSAELLRIESLPLANVHSNVSTSDDSSSSAVLDQIPADNSFLISGTKSDVLLRCVTQENQGNDKNKVEQEKNSETNRTVAYVSADIHDVLKCIANEGRIGSENKTEDRSVDHDDEDFDAIITIIGPKDANKKGEPLRESEDQVYGQTDGETGKDGLIVVGSEADTKPTPSSPWLPFYDRPDIQLHDPTFPKPGDEFTTLKSSFLESTSGATSEGNFNDQGNNSPVGDNKIQWKLRPVPGGNKQPSQTSAQQQLIESYPQGVPPLSSAVSQPLVSLPQESFVDQSQQPSTVPSPIPPQYPATQVPPNSFKKK
ncbi:hypothetical protein QAD02_019891, partial [Eretmocerus hayati]